MDLQDFASFEMTPQKRVKKITVTGRLTRAKMQECTADTANPYISNKVIDVTAPTDVQFDCSVLRSLSGIDQGKLKDYPLVRVTVEYL